MPHLNKDPGAALDDPPVSQARGRNSNALRILAYHRFAGMEPSFAAQCDHLMTHYRPISLSEAHRRLSNGDSEPDHAVVLTVDDGYRDFYTSAFPILKSRGIPATMFLVTGFVDGRLWLWTEQVRYALEHTAKTVCEIPVGNHALRMPLHTPRERNLAVEFLKQALKAVPDRDRRITLASLPRILKVAIPHDPPAGQEPITWDQAREMAGHGFEFGGHTQTHPILSQVNSEATLKSEISGCRARIEQELQSPVRHFCYPNGKPGDLNEGVIAATREAGYESAVSTIWGLNLPGVDPYLLRRYSVDADVPLEWFERVAAGFYLQPVSPSPRL